VKSINGFEFGIEVNNSIMLFVTALVISFSIFFLSWLFKDVVSRLRAYSVDGAMNNECGAVGGMRIGRGNEAL
jgi:hypothetical protein